jgi:hypothetical protein
MIVPIPPPIITQPSNSQTSYGITEPQWIGYMNPGNCVVCTLANSKVSAGPPLGSYDQPVQQTTISFDFEPTNDGWIVGVEDYQMLKD